MFKDFKSKLIDLLFSRTFAFGVIIIILFAIVVHRLFVLQIVNGKEYQENFTLRIRKESTISSTRGKIYDANGVLLAHDDLAYSVTIEDNYDSTGQTKNREINEAIYKLIKILEKHNSDVIMDFNIVLDEDENFAYKVEGTQLLRFLADVYGQAEISKLKVNQRNASPDEVIEYMCSSTKYGIGEYTEGEKGKFNFSPMQGYSKKELLEIINIRYQLSLNSYQKYIPTTVATSLDNECVAQIMENKSDMQGVDIAEDTVRKYINEISLSPIIGYTGKISQEELAEFNKDGKSDYELNDMVGKAGIEQIMETSLQGVKGKRTMYVDNLGKIAEIESSIDPVAGNDLYLTIDSKLQAAIYDIIEQKLAGIIVSRIQNIKEYHQGENESAASIVIPIDDVYYALFNNSVIDINHMNSDKAGQYEKEVYAAFYDSLCSSLDEISDELLNNKTPYNELSETMQNYESYILSYLSSPNIGILRNELIVDSDEIYQAWKNEEISLGEFLRHCIIENWIDTTKLDSESTYSDSEEIYNTLVEKIHSLLLDNTAFYKRVMKYVIANDKVSDVSICLVLYEQDIIPRSAQDKQRLLSGEITAYDFMVDKIRNIEITPAQLALDPCSGSCVITDVNTGQVKACVSYPTYDNNRLANTMDAQYWNSLTTDLSNPLYSYASQQKTAPGSTFKIVSAIAGLEENVINIGEGIECLGEFDKVDNPHCWIYPSAHGMLTVSGGITNSCNFFFYEVGYRLGTDKFGRYNPEDGLEKLRKYASLFGLNEVSGIELTETEPNMSDEDAVRSAIGQGTNSYTTVQLSRYVTTVANKGTCYKLSILDKLTDPTGKTIEDFNSVVRNKVNIPESDWTAVHQGMKGVVENSSAFKDSLLSAAGKTGTAQQVRTRPNHALFVGFTPYNNPEISIATRIAYGYNSAYAAELSRDVFQYYYGVKDEKEILTGKASVPSSGLVSD